jgi:hypothetical protein
VNVATQTSISRFALCPRLYEIEFVRLYRPVREARELALGRIWHQVQEAWWSRGEWAAPLWQITDDYERARWQVLAAGYDVRWEHGEYATIAVEKQFSFPFAGWEIQGQVDGIVEDDSGRTWLLEHKTTSSDLGSASGYWARLQHNRQISLYLEGLRQLGYTPAGCLYDVVCKPDHAPYLATPEHKRRLTKAGKLYASQRDADESVEAFTGRIGAAIAENPDRYYARTNVLQLEGESDEALRDVMDTLRLMDACAASGRFPRNPDACWRYGRPCDYWPVCTGSGSLDDSSAYRRLAEPHPELAANRSSP